MNTFLSKVTNIKFLKQYQGLPRSIYMIVIARFFNSMGFFVYPFMTLFLTTQFNYTTAQVGTYILVLSLAFIPGAAIGSKIADKFNRKMTYVVITLLADFFFIIAGAFYTHEWVLIVLIVAFFFHNSANPVLTSMAMDLTTPMNRQESFSLMSIGLNLGFAMGPSMASVLFENHTAWLFWGQALLNLLGMSIIFFTIKDTHLSEQQIKDLEKEGRAAEAGSSEGFLKIIFKHPLVLAFVAAAAAIAFMYAQFFYMMPLNLKDLFGTSAGASYYSTVCLINGLGIVVLAPFIVMATKKFNPLFNLTVAAALYGIGFGLNGVAHQPWMFMVFALIWTTGEVLVTANISVFLANHSPVTHRARFQSLYDITHALGRAIGPKVLGTYLLVHTFSDAWSMITIIGIATCLWFLTLGLIETRQLKKQAK